MHFKAPANCPPIYFGDEGLVAGGVLGLQASFLNVLRAPLVGQKCRHSVVKDTASACDATKNTLEALSGKKWS